MNSLTSDTKPADTQPASPEPAEPDDTDPEPIAASGERPPLRRPFHGRMLTGTAAGVADYLGADPTLIRIAFVVLVFIGGAGIPLYLAGLLLIPEEGSDQSIASSLLDSVQGR